MNMKPTPKLINDWHEKARQMAIQAAGYFDGVEYLRHFAELAAQWGSGQAQREAENAPWLTTAHMICTDAGIAHGPISGRLEALRDKLADKARQTTDPLGFQIRRAIAAEDELRATKQTLEHAYAALQKVADAQAAIEEPELPEAVAYINYKVDCSPEPPYEEVRREKELGFKKLSYGYAVRDAESFYTAAQMHDHFHAGVRAGMAQSQDAKRYRILRDAKYQLHEDDISVSDSSFNAYFGDELDLEVDALASRYDAAMQGGRK